MTTFTLSIPDFLSSLPNHLFFIRQDVMLLAVFLVLLVISFSSSLGKFIGKWLTILAFTLATMSYFSDFFQIEEPTQIFSGFLTIDKTSLLFKLLITISGLLALLIYNTSETENKTIVYPILILSTVLGLNILAMSTHWAMAFLALETVSISSYLLVSFEKTISRSEAGVRYLLFGATASAVMLYGITWIYGISGNLSMEQIVPDSPIFTLPLILVIGGLLFKISGFPFHFWAPDTYQGAPAYLLPFLSYAPKLGGFIVLIKFSTPTLSHNPDLLLPILAIAAIGSLMVGNWGALRQDNSLRLMAYSGIAQAGFVLAAISCGKSGIDATLYYLTIYLPMNFLVFYVLYLVGKKNETYSIRDLQGMGATSPLLSVVLLIGLVALAGLPPTIGFQGKLLIFSALWETYSTTNDNIYLILLISAGLFTLTSFYFYLKIPYYIFIKRNETKLSINLFFSEKVLIMVLGAPLIILFFMPQKLNNFIKLINLVY